MCNLDLCAELLGDGVVWLRAFLSVVTPLLSVLLFCSASATSMFCVSQSHLSLLSSQGILPCFKACVEIVGKGELLSVDVVHLSFVKENIHGIKFRVRRRQQMVKAAFLKFKGQILSWFYTLSLFRYHRRSHRALHCMVKYKMCPTTLEIKNSWHWCTQYHVSSKSTSMLMEEVYSLSSALWSTLSFGLSAIHYGILLITYCLSSTVP